MSQQHVTSPPGLCGQLWKNPAGEDHRTSPHQPGIGFRVNETQYHFGCLHTESPMCLGFLATPLIDYTAYTCSIPELLSVSLVTHS